MVNGFGSRAAARALLPLALVGCGAPVESYPVGTGGASNAVSAAGGVSTSAGASGSATGGSGGSIALGGAGAGGAGPAQALTLSFSWSTYWLKGTTKTPLTCADLGAESVRFSISGEAPDSAEQVLSYDGESCASGAYQNYPLALPPGAYSLGISLATGLATDSTLKALLSGLASFSVAPGATHLDLPEIKLVRIMLPLSWSIEKSGSTSTCANVGATQVDLVLTEVRDDYVNTISWSQPCSLNPSQPLAKPGTYRLSATLKNDSSTLATWAAPDKLSFSTESAAIPPAITFKVP
jgi:hypothetical protein